MQSSRVQRCQKTPRQEHLQWNLRKSKEFREIESRDRKQAVADLDHEDKQSLLYFRKDVRTARQILRANQNIKDQESGSDLVPDKFRDYLRNSLGSGK